MFEVSLKPRHPTGVYHRAGIEFSRSAPVLLEKVPKAVQDDPWLVVKEVAGKNKEPKSDDNKSKGSAK